MGFKPRAGRPPQTKNPYLWRLNCNPNDTTDMTTCTEIFERARAASRKLALLDAATIDRTLRAVADRIGPCSETILASNALDLERMDPSDPRYDRLKLTPERLQGIADDMRNVASLPSPVGLTLDQTTRPNGMTITKVSVPFGVIGIIYEARPNVGFDCFSLCFKSGNAVILKGGSDALHSNEAIVELIRSTLAAEGIEPDTVQLLPADHAATAEMLEAVGYVDLVIPRGSQRLISFVRDNARVPVIETGAGICHTYFDRAGDKVKGALIVNNAKTRRVSVCNALDCLVIHRERLHDLPLICNMLADSNVTIYADPEAFEALRSNYPTPLLKPATPESFGTEFLSYRMAIRTVGSLDEAIDHITRYSSKHSEAIISEDPEACDAFVRRVDAACVYCNVSTAFTDGAQFGMGAEIGISTQKLHARGPMALRELTSYKYIVRGDGQIRS